MSLVTFYAPQAAAGGTLDFAEEYFLSSNYVAQEKLDGARYVLHKRLDGTVCAYSRRTSVQTHLPVDKTAQLRHIVDEFDRQFPNGTVLDGEVVAPGAIRVGGRPQKTSSNLVTRFTGASPEVARQYQEENGYVEYAVFDCLAYDGRELTDRPLSERLNALQHLYMGVPELGEDGGFKYISALPFCVGEDRKRRMYETVIKRGGEGIILKDLHAPYHCGKRHKSWVKVKRERTFDVVFMGIELAKETSTKKSGDVSATRIAGQAGAIRFGQFRTVSPLLPPALTELGTVGGFDDATRLDITANADSYTKNHRVFEVRAQEQFESGALRHPRFVQWRDDKVAEDCVLRTDES